MRSYWIRLGPKANDWYLFKKGGTHRHTHQRLEEYDDGEDTGIMQI